MRKVLKTVFCMGIGFGIGLFLKNGKMLSFYKKLSEKYRQYYKTLYRWVVIKNEKKRISDYFIKNKMMNIAMYGMGEFGYAFLQEMKGSEINIKYVIDKNANSIEMKIPVACIEDITDDIDVIVVTIIDRYETIKKDLEKNTTAKIVSLEEILFQA